MKRTGTRSTIGLVAAVLTVLTIAAGCSSGGNDGSASSASPGASTTDRPASDGSASAAGGAQALTKARLVEAWYAKGEDGGYFAALQQGDYRDAGVDLTIQPGGPQV
jgi:NitT/TauT family transport system substrate-binding protein